MMRRAPVRITWLFGALGVAIAVACKGSTAPHQPTLCPSYSGGASQGDSLYGLYHLVSYCLDTLPAFTPPAESGHVTLTRAGGVDSFIAVLVAQGQAPESILGTYTHPLPDSIHVTGNVRVSGVAVPVEVLGRFLLQQNTLSVSGRLAVTLTSPHFLSFIGARSAP
ncbi:MAG: hypothetical protein DMD44_04875 [Gemmatimonadetes bacterium]|nr:MAG: hypothetical protein DMD44_04875 [Gemmatimonadota bacterium]